MIEENAAADFRRRIDVTLEDRRRAALQIEREVLAALQIQPMRKTMRLDGVKALVVEHGLDKAAGRRIAVDRGHDIGSERFPEDRLIFERVVIGLADHVRRNVGVIQPLADAVRDRGLERVVMQDVLIDESGELGLAARDILAFSADARPDRIDLVEAPCRPRLILSHEPGSPDASRTPT